MKLSRQSLVPLGIGVLLIVIALAWSPHGGPREVWLPPNDSGTWPDGTISLLESSTSVRNWRYGEGTLFTTTKGSAGSIFEAPAGQFGLDPASCPNVFAEEAGPPGWDCQKVGTIDGHDIYNIDRDLPRGAVDVYAVLGDTFIASNSGGVGESQINAYFQSFKRYTPDEAQKFLADNKNTAAAHNKQTQADNDHEKALEAKAYQNLPFTPALPTTPDGWKNTERTTIYGDGKPPVPRFIETDYQSTSNKDLYVRVDMAKLSEFQLANTCGPTIGAGAARLTCQQVPGTDYYQAWSVGDNYAVRYMYRPVGDALVTVSVGSYQSNRVQDVSQEELTAQEAIVKSLAPVSPDAFRNAAYQSGASAFLFTAQ